MPKPLDWAIRTVRNEAECILGWAKQALYFCDKVVAIIDPDTTDKTEELLRTYYPEVLILWQDRSMGDSDNQTKGKTGALIAHVNLEYWVNKLVADGEWFYQCAPDERFNPTQWPAIAEEIRMVRRLGLAQGIFYTTMHNFYPDETHCIDYYSQSFVQWGTYRYFEVWEKDGPWHKHAGAHTGSAVNPHYRRWWWSLYPFYHYNWLIRPMTHTWRYDQIQNRYASLPQYFLQNPIPHWRTLS
jgi:hypothetical protein